MIADEDLHQHALENVDQGDALVNRLELASRAVAMRYEPRR
jgi:hypothetical protein